MPKCKNDPKKSYKGTEPSPKGLGYCAHDEKLGKIRKGKDGNTWKVESTKSGVLRWIKLKENKKIIGKHYFIHENYSRPFVVFINKNKVDVYKQSKENYDYDKCEHLQSWNTTITVMSGDLSEKSFKDLMNSASF